MSSNVRFHTYIHDQLYFYKSNGEIVKKSDLISPLDLNTNQYKKWLNTFPEQNAEEIFDSIYHINWDTFKTNLFNASKKFASKNIYSYYQYIPDSMKNSIGFMSALVYQNGSLDYNQVDDFGNKFDETNHENVCYIDDCIYSGSQLTQFLNKVHHNFDNYRKSFIRKSNDDIEYTKINFSYQGLLNLNFITNVESIPYNENVLFGSDENDVIYFIVASDHRSIAFYDIDEFISEAIKYKNYGGFNILDDAIFATKMIYLDINAKRKLLTLHLIIPYIYEKGYNKIMECKNKRINVELYYEQIINEPVFKNKLTELIYNLYCIIPNLIEEMYMEDITTMEELYEVIENNKNKISTICFDHKIASPASTIFSSILGCGLVLSPQMIFDKVEIYKVGPLINAIELNTDVYMKNLQEYVYGFDDDGYNSDRNEDECLDMEVCNKVFTPIYKMSDDKLNELING